MSASGSVSEPEDEDEDEDEADDEADDESWSEGDVETGAKPDVPDVGNAVGEPDAPGVTPCDAHPAAAKAITPAANSTRTGTLDRRECGDRRECRDRECRDISSPMSEYPPVRTAIPISIRRTRARQD